MSDTESTATSLRRCLKSAGAPFKSFSPILMDMAGAPPKPTQVPNEDKSVTMGTAHAHARQRERSHFGHMPDIDAVDDAV